MLPLVIEGIVRTAVQGVDAEMPLRYNDTLFQDIEYYLPYPQEPGYSKARQVVIL